MVLQALGLGLLGIAGGWALLAGRSVGSGFTDAFHPQLGLDPLSGLFLLALGAVGVPAAAYATAALPGAPAARTLGVLTGLFPVALAGVLTARDVVTFLAAWELMTLVPAAAVLVAHGDPAGRRGIYEYLAITHVGGAGVWIALLVLAQDGALADPAGLASAGAGTQALVGIAGLIGFGTKAGLVPLHAWLPRAHPLAPAHVSALMSGVMVKVALYGLVRLVFSWLGGPPAWAGYALVALGALSAVTGVLYAVFQRDLKRLLAFSTIENVGIAALALGAAAIFAARGDDGWAALAMAAALLHVLNHAVVKGLLFLGAGAAGGAAGGFDLDRMGGLLRRMPWTGPALLVGALAIAGVPVLNVFASEWSTVQALLGLGRAADLGAAMTGALAIAALGATVGLGAVCFVKVIGLVLLGAPRTARAASAGEAPVAMRGAVVALACGCVALGLAPGLLMPALARIAPGDGSLPLGAGISAAGTSLPTLAVALTLAAVVGALALARGRRRSAPAPVWLCGQPPDPRLAWSSAAFTKPVLLVLSGVLRPERSVEVSTTGGVVHEVRHRSTVPHLFDALLYAPAVRVALAGAGVARRLQSGSLRLYIGYLVGLVLLLLLLARSGALG